MRDAEWTFNTFIREQFYVERDEPEEKIACADLLFHQEKFWKVAK